MQFSAVLLAGFAALVSAQTYTGPTITNTSPAPAGCTGSYPGTFEVSVVNATTASKVKRSTSPNALLISLDDGVLTDNEGRIGYIASNYQFQFDFGGQAGEKYGAGFSICANNTLALGSSAVWYECLSGSFYNIYDESWAAQCKPVFLDIIPQSGSASTTTAVATTTTDGQVAGTTVASAVTSSAAIATSITDHQVQGATTTTPVTSSVVVVSSVKAVTSSAAIVTSITDHQIQGATTTSAVVSSVVVVSTVAIVSSISDHQIQAPTTSAVVTAYTGAAAMPTMAAQMLLAAAGAAAVLL